MKSTYEIKAAVSHIGLNVGSKKIYSYPRTGHHFWILVSVSDGVETMVDSIHGLATRLKIDKDGNAIFQSVQMFSTWHSYLQLYSIPFPESVHLPEKHARLSWTPPAETYTVYSEADTLLRWQAAKDWIETFNASKLSYSILGLGKILGFSGCQNSNSAYASVASFLNLEPHRFKNYLAPGIQSLLFKTIVEYNHEPYTVGKSLSLSIK